MKYFTKKLWTGRPFPWSDGDAASWNKARHAYWKQLDTLRPRFAPDVFAFFERADVHEGVLLHVDVIDGCKTIPAPPWPSLHGHPVRVELALEDVYGRLAWTLRYAGVRRVLIDFPSAEPLLLQDWSGFGALGFHELTDCGGGFFRHEVVFASGATLLVEFRDIDVDKRERAVQATPA